MTYPLEWILFNAFILVMLLLDLGVFNKKARVIPIREALIWSGVWIVLALLFNIFIYYMHGKEAALNFLTGYLIEKSLSIDNLFVFLLIFTYFQVPKENIHKVLYWGILGALVMRALFIFAGISLLQYFHWMIYVFGIFLIYTGYKIAFKNIRDLKPEDNYLVKLCKKFFAIHPHYVADKFFIKKEGKTFATPLLLVLMAIESTDIIFAIDSIPAILAITRDSFIVYTSNVFAILGLRALYFALQGLLDNFHYLSYGLALILTFVGIKMMVDDFYPISIFLTLFIVIATLLSSIVLSIMFPKDQK
jgi:tellurite resistance protein TerC